MIKSQDIRIGNLIFSEDGHVSKIVGIKPYDHNVRCDEQEGCELIVDEYRVDGNSSNSVLSDTNKSNYVRLTEEWLKKMGRPSASHEWEYEISVNALKWHFRYNTEWYSEIGGIYIDSKVQYVHQIQNMYHSFTGTELKINL